MEGVCKYYLQDKCTYGKNCRFYHPPRNQLQSSLRGTNNTVTVRLS